jgi:hypothetical protein
MIRYQLEKKQFDDQQAVYSIEENLTYKMIWWNLEMALIR